MRSQNKSKNVLDLEYAEMERQMLNLNINRLADRMAQQRTEPEAVELISVTVIQRAPTRRGLGCGGNWATDWR